MVLSCGIEQVSSRDQSKDATFAEAETLLHGHSFVQTIDSFQANLGVRLQSCSQWMGGLPFQKRFPFHSFSHLSSLCGTCSLFNSALYR